VLSSTVFCLASQSTLSLPAPRTHALTPPSCSLSRHTVHTLAHTTVSRPLILFPVASQWEVLLRHRGGADCSLACYHSSGSGSSAVTSPRQWLPNTAALLLRHRWQRVLPRRAEITILNIFPTLVNLKEWPATLDGWFSLCSLSMQSSRCMARVSFVPFSNRSFTLSFTPVGDITQVVAGLPHTRLLYRMQSLFPFRRGSTPPQGPIHHFRSPTDDPAARFPNCSPKAFLTSSSTLVSIFRRSCRLVPGFLKGLLPFRFTWSLFPSIRHLRAPLVTLFLVCFFPTMCPLRRATPARQFILPWAVTHIFRHPSWLWARSFLKTSLLLRNARSETSLS
jgi:hypothetical protein